MVPDPGTSPGIEAGTGQSMRAIAVIDLNPGSRFDHASSLDTQVGCDMYSGQLIFPDNGLAALPWRSVRSRRHWHQERSTRAWAAASSYLSTKRQPTKVSPGDGSKRADAGSKGQPGRRSNEARQGGWRRCGMTRSKHRCRRQKIVAARWRSSANKPRERRKSH